MKSTSHIDSPNLLAPSASSSASHRLHVVGIERLGEFDDIIDVRSPAEFAEDHIPGAINCPVLDNDERIEVGTLYKQVSPFDAKKRGAALVAKNIALHLQQSFSGKPKHWKPLIYCWRGGTRSGVMTYFLQKIGWSAQQLDGGYRAYRRYVIEQLASLPHKFDFRVVCGATGSGKSRLLNALEAQGAQVLDLEALAAHRGSVLGDLPDTPQPPQKMFDSMVWNKLSLFDPAKPVYVEAESKKIGVLHVPGAILHTMWQRGRCVHIDAAMEARVRFLRGEYRHLFITPAPLMDKLNCLKPLLGAERLQQWNELAHQSRWDELVHELLESHYDPAYRKSTLLHYPQIAQGITLRTDDLSAANMRELARGLIAQSPH